MKNIKVTIVVSPEEQDDIADIAEVVKDSIYDANEVGIVDVFYTIEDVVDVIVNEENKEN